MAERLSAVAAHVATPSAADTTNAIEAELVCGYSAGGQAGTSKLGEGPMWSPAEECLYWVDCSGKKIHRFDPERDAAHRHTEWSLDEHIGCLVLRQGGGFMAAVTSGFVAVSLPEHGGAAVCTPFAPLAQDTGSNYDPALGYDPDAAVRGMNDGKCDRAGRFWAGTVLTPTGRGPSRSSWVGKLWRLEASGEAVEVLPNIACSQGPSWSPDNKTMYYHDSSGGGIKAFDFDHGTGAISNERAFATDFDLKPGESGGPDGFTVRTMRLCMHGK